MDSRIWSSKYYFAWLCKFPGGAANTDGVVMKNSVVGYTGNFTPPFDYGRTATHEVRHWLNLRHIWGDDSPQAQQNGGV
jgi:hypothetical protein